MVGKQVATRLEREVGQTSGASVLAERTALSCRQPVLPQVWTQATEGWEEVWGGGKIAATHGKGTLFRHSLSVLLIKLSRKSWPLVSF